MWKPDARISSLIISSGFNPDDFTDIREEPGWIHAINRTTGILTHFDLERKHACYTWEPTEMYYKQAQPGMVWVLTQKGALNLPERIRKGAEAGQSIPGRETSVPINWHLKKWVVEEWQN